MVAKNVQSGQKGKRYNNNNQRFQLFIGIFTYWQQTVKTEASNEQQQQSMPLTTEYCIHSTLVM